MRRYEEGGWTGREKQRGDKREEIRGDEKARRRVEIRLLSLCLRPLCILTSRSFPEHKFVPCVKSIVSLCSEPLH